MPTVRSEGVRLAVEVVGEGEPVTVVGHGLTGSRVDLAILAPFVPGTKVLFDFRGHGESERPGPGAYSMDHFAADVDNVATAFGATALVGASLGGGATLRLLLSKPDRFQRLVILLPARLERATGAREKLLRLADLLEQHPLEKVADIVVAEEDAEGAFDGFPSTRALRRDAILRMHRDGMPAAIRESIADPPVGDGSVMSRVTTPTLIVAQEGDPVHAASVARELAAAMPNAELLLFPHPQALARDIPAVTSRVAEFLTT